MKRLLALALVVCAPALHADSPALTLEQQQLPSPAPVGAHAPQFVHTSDGVALGWNETDAAGQIRHLRATWMPVTLRWTAPQTAPLPDTATTDGPRVRFPDGSQLRVFFPQRDGRIFDLHTQRIRAEQKSEVRPLSADSWPESSTPDESPSLIAREARALAVWRNLAEKPPRLFAAISTSAGEQFFLPVRIDDGRTPGHANAIILRDGSSYITWIETHRPENTTALWLRRLSPAGDPSVPVLIAIAPSADTLGHPQLAALKDYDATPGELLLAHEFTSGDTRQIVVRLLKLPPAESFLQGRPCLTCPPDTATLPGYPLEGIVISTDSEKHEAVIQHAEIPGILPAGKTTFRIDAQTTLSSGNHVVARTEKRDGTWHLFDARTLSIPPPF